MYTIQSYQASGERLTHVGQRPAFYSLAYNGVIVEYYTTIEALTLGKASIEALLTSEANTVKTPKLRVFEFTFAKAA